MSQEDLGKSIRTGRPKPEDRLSGPTISRWEREESEPSIDQLRQLVRVLEIMPAPLLREMGFDIPAPANALVDDEELESLLRTARPETLEALKPILRLAGLGNDESGRDAS